MLKTIISNYDFDKNTNLNIFCKIYEIVFLVYYFEIKLLFSSPIGHIKVLIK